MGSNSSKGKKHQDTSQYGEIYLQTDKTAYCAGDTVIGTIYLNLISHYPGNQLFLKLKGKEVVHFAEPENDDDDDIKHKYSDKNQITKLVILVHTWETLSPGQFAIPFSFYLSHHLPSSFYQHGCEYLAFTEYKLETFLQPQTDTDPKMKYKQLLVLRPRIPPNNNEYLSSSVTTDFACCCCKQGSNILKVSFEKNFYYPGETARVNVELDNSNTKIKNEKIYFAFTQSLELKAQRKTFGTQITKTKQKLPGIPKGIKTNSGTINLVLPRSPKEGDFEKVDTKNPKLLTLLHLPENLDVITSTTQGDLIKSTYFLEVYCVMSGCCTYYPKVKLPITILSPDVHLPVINAPGKWQPITLESVNLLFPIYDNEASKPLLSGPNGNMIEGKVIGKQSFEMIETRQMHPNQQGTNNQNYFKNFS